MDYKLQLNEKQLEAVTTEDQYCRIIAGAGSGKTRVLTFRISYLIERCHVNPRSILAITFTNKAANEMKDRVLKLLPDVSGVNVMTFHSFCARFLRREIAVLNISRNFVILDDEDQGKLIKNILKEEGYAIKDPIAKILPGYISAKKNNGEYPDDVSINPLNPLDRELLQLYRRYEAKLKETESLDFDDLLLVTYRILRDFKDVRERWQRYYAHILVDEFQDTNIIQYKLVKFLLDETTSLYVVGDPDQTIYTWRGANQDIIMDLENEFTIKTVTLEENYRSTKEILDSANKLIRNNKKRLEKNLYTNISGGDKVVFHCYRDQYEEARFVVNEIKKLTMDKYDYKDIVIMYRSNYLTLPYEKALTQERIPYEIYGGLKFYQRKEVKDLLAYIRLIVNIKDDISWERIFNVPRRGIGESTIEKLKEEALAHQETFAQYIENIEISESTLPTRQLRDMKDLVALIRQYQERQEQGTSIEDIVDQLIDDIHYYDYLKNLDDNYEDRVSNIKTLVDDIAHNAGTEGYLSLEEYMQNIALMSSQDYMEERNKITLLTVHTAKGLEFPVVFLVSMNEGVFPNARALEEKSDGIEEERRLCYVAFTRAMRKLYVTSYFNSFRGSYSVPSSFVRESGLEAERQKIVSSGPAVIKKPLTTFISKPTIISPNGIKWSLGDKVHHTAFGDGEVVEIDGAYIRVDFINHGIKKLVGNHPTLTKVEGDHHYEA